MNCLTYKFTKINLKCLILYVDTNSEKGTPHPESTSPDEYVAEVEVNYTNIDTETEGIIFSSVPTNKWNKNQFGCISSQDASARFKRKSVGNSNMLKVNESSESCKFHLDLTQVLIVSQQPKLNLKREQTMHEMILHTCSTPEAAVVTTEYYIPSEMSEPENKNTPKVQAKKEAKMDQLRPAKPEEVHNVLQEKNDNSVISMNYDKSTMSVGQSQDEVLLKTQKPRPASKTSMNLAVSSLETELK